MILGKTVTGAIALVCALAGSSVAAPAPSSGIPVPAAYPPAKRGNVVEDYFGTPVADPYRALENVFSAETEKFANAQNALTRKTLEAFPERARFQRDLEKILRFTRFGTPFKKGDYYYYFMNKNGASAQSSLYRTKSLRNPNPELFVDPNLLSPGGYDRMEFPSFSPDLKKFAFIMTKNETDYAYLNFRDVSTKKPIHEIIRYADRGNVEWLNNGTAIAYYRYPIPTGVTWEEAGTNVDRWPDNWTLYYHVFGTDPAKDVPCTVATCGRAESGQAPAASNLLRGKVPKAVGVSDGKGGVIQVTLPSKRDRNLVAGAAWDMMTAADVDENAVPKVPEGSHATTYIASDNGVDYYQTGAGASNFKIIAVPSDAATGVVARDIIPADRTLVLESAQSLGNGYFALFYLEDVLHNIRIVKADAQRNPTEIVFKFPFSDGVATDIRADDELGTVTFNYGNYLNPGTVYMYTLATNKLEVFRKHQIPQAVSHVTSDQLFFTSRDGARIPTFTVRPKNAKKDGENRIWVYGYGGFRANMLPSFNAFAVALARHYGGIWALVNIRGGAEYGLDWYENGRLFKKQNCFNDIADAAQFYIKEGWTKEGLLSIHGGSNGGLLTGAVSLQNPTLFGAGISDYGVHDTLRFVNWTYGPGWTDDYGKEGVAAEVLSALKWSPVYNVKPNVTYPSMLITTGDHDTRVAPPHSYKFAAELQFHTKKVKNARPVLLRVREWSGHNIFSLRRYADTYADKVTFWAKALGAKYRS
ncbi:hypothetical protein PhCBS80983_g03603 [Powellomyces hirtus]|uniref:Prolyl endopeptidase n=1 Tax=Powellomyces hirtus TaxID=109895 RepID=A0A507E3V7_9FUNG|nr:hypothetical protein PhCBS80983_g03603 [Powellomyces hirtus]